MLTRLGRLGRRVLPAPLFNILRDTATALVAPFHFSSRTGHWKSSLLRRAVDSNGQPLPWYTYPAINLLQDQDFHDRSVLEWGAGQSTLWWGARARKVLSFESNPSWISYVRNQVPSSVEIRHVHEDLPSWQGLDPAETFDIIVIDGLNRIRCASLSAPLLSDRGAILFDNSEGRWGPPILKHFRDLGFQRIDLHGFAPGVVAPHCTSIFFRERCFLFEGTNTPHQPS